MLDRRQCHEARCVPPSARPLHRAAAAGVCANLRPRRICTTPGQVRRRSTGPARPYHANLLRLTRLNPSPLSAPRTGPGTLTGSESESRRRDRRSLRQPAASRSGPRPPPGLPGPAIRVPEPGLSLSSPPPSPGLGGQSRDPGRKPEPRAAAAGRPEGPRRARPGPAVLLLVMTVTGNAHDDAGQLDMAVSFNVTGPGIEEFSIVLN